MAAEFLPLKSVVINFSDPYRPPQGFAEDPTEYTSSLNTGVPTYARIEFLSGSYTGTDKKTYQFSGLLLETAVVAIDQSKQIVRTNIQGRDGTVKEYIGLDDYQVHIQGVLTGANGVYPADDVAALKALCTAPISLKISSRYLQLWDIDELVIMDFSIPQIPGEYSKQPFAINCVSNDPIELRFL